MAAKASRRLVIDTSVARSVGGKDVPRPRSKNCRDFLTTALTVCHHVVMTPEINQEWKRHRSEFFVDWLQSMFARKKVFYLSDVVDKVLQSKIEKTAMDTRSAEAMRKDCLLIEAAIATDRLVASLDETARRLFVKAARRIRELRSI